MKHAFTEEQLGEMIIFMEEIFDGKMEGRYTAPIVAVFEKRFEETFKKLAEGGRTPALLVLYMVDTIKIFIRSERLADYNGHLVILGVPNFKLLSQILLQELSLNHFTCDTRHLSEHLGEKKGICLQIGKISENTLCIYFYRIILPN